MARITLSSWPLGADNVQDEYSSVFSPAEGQPARLVEAQNVDLDNDGRPSLRPGTTERLTGTNFLSGGSYAGLFLLQDQGTIHIVTEGTPFTTSSPVTGLNASAAVYFYEFAGQVFYTNGLVNGRFLSDGSALPWGLGVAPSPTLGSTAGDLPAGLYRVAATLVNDADKDRAGNTIETEGGALKAASITVDGTKDITATLTPGDSNATHVNFYISEPNQEELFFTKQVAVGALPATITDYQYSKRPLRTQHMQGPIAGDGIFSFLGYIMIWSNNWIFRSKGHTPNLFHPREEVFGFPYNVQAAAGLQDGFYVATSKGLHWVTQTGERVWKKKQKDSKQYTTGSLIRESDDFPFLKLSGEKVAIFGCEDGLAFGLPEGQVMYVTDERLDLASVPTKSSFLYRKSSDLRQLLMHLA